MFFKREQSKEIMDDMSIQDERIDTAFNELKIINKYLGGKTVTSEGIKKFSNNSGKETLIILDAGAGGSDLIKDNRNYHKFKIVALDKNKRAAAYIRNKGGDEIPVCGDVLFLPFRSKAFDLVHCSLFLHHFSEQDLHKILYSFIQLSRRGIVINDLRRSVPAYLGIKILTALFSRSEFVKNDAPLSVRKAFSRNDLTGLMKTLNIQNYTLKRRWAFRWLLIIYIDEKLV